MIELESVAMRNFLSYGNNVTKIKLSGLGQCFIKGIVQAEDTGHGQIAARSNGAGKSNLVNAILWCLAGKTMHDSNPGDSVMHYFNKENCWVQLEFKGGGTLTRNRTRRGEVELLLEAPGKAVISTAQGTTGYEQQRLNKELGFDWDLFCGSVFFSQFGRPWLEMADQQRKQVIERVLHIDRFSIYADIAKAKKSTAESDQSAATAREKTLITSLLDQKTHIEQLKQSKESFQSLLQAKKDKLFQQVSEYEMARDRVTKVDVVKLKAKWDLVAQIRAKLQTHKDTRDTAQMDIRSAESRISDLNKKINLWKSRDGKLCAQCEQDIPHAHIKAKTSPFEIEQSKLTAKLAEHQETYANHVKIINSTEEKIKQCEPTMSVREAESINREWDRLDKLVADTKLAAEQIGNEENPHIAAVERAEERLAKLESDIAKIKESSATHDLIIKHYNYINRAYSDRKKIKSAVIGEHIPYFNARLSHYLDTFDLDVRICLTDSLAVDSNMWGYKYLSGGERMRTNVAFTLSMFDLHEAIYGRQSNIMVLDEVDGALDDHGVQCLVNVIKTDLANKVESLLIISHKDTMHDVFPRQITVERTADSRESIVIEAR